MRLEDQVCSLGLAKRLKELGVKQESYFFYEWYSDDSHRLTCKCEWIHVQTTKISAFTSAELGEMLPDFIIKDGCDCYIKSQKKGDEYKIYIDGLVKVSIFFDKNEADARAKMLIYLIENGLIKEQELFYLETDYRDS